MASIRESIEMAVQYLSEHPEEALYTDSFARATLGEALQVRVDGPDGEHIDTDMPRGVGGMGQKPTPGWLFRASIASCVASTVGMELAREGLAPTTLEVEVDSRSDDRGILGMESSVPVGPLSIRIRIRAAAEGVDDDRLRQIVDRGARRCPVGDAAQRAVDVELEIETT